MAGPPVPKRNRVPSVHLSTRRLTSAPAQAATLSKNVMNDLLTEAGAGYHTLQRTGMVPVQGASGKSPIMTVDPHGTKALGTLDYSPTIPGGSLCGKRVTEAKLSVCIKRWWRRYVKGRSVECWYEDCQGHRAGSATGHEWKEWSQFDLGCICQEYPRKYKEHYSKHTSTGCIKQFEDGL